MDDLEALAPPAKRYWRVDSSGSDSADESWFVVAPSALAALRNVIAAATGHGHYDELDALEAFELDVEFAATIENAGEGPAKTLAECVDGDVLSPWF